MSKGNNTREPWERQENEAVKAFEAFAAYRDMGTTRSTAKVAQHLGKTKTLIDGWCSRHSWVARVEAWTDEQDRISREELTKGITKMRKNHVDIASAMLVTALKALQAVKPEALTARDISTMVDIAAKLERLSRGEVTERTESRTEHTGGLQIRGDPYEELTADELRRLLEIEDGQQRAAD